MGKKIRHLEYYGFSDQNGYLSLPEFELSGIHETNKEQDSEITKLKETDEALSKRISNIELNQGEGIVTTNKNERAIGMYNVSHTSSDASGSTILSIGIGTSDTDRKNAIEVMKDGSVYMWIEDDFIKVNDKIVAMAVTTTSTRNPQDSSPTYKMYSGDKEKLNSILSHFKMGWFDGDGKLVYECAKGRISKAVDGTDIPIDGSLKGPNGESCDLLLYTDTSLYIDRCNVSGLTVEGSNGATQNVIGISTSPHQIHGKTAKKFEPFGFTPQVAKYKTFNDKQVGYSYYDGGRIQTSISSLDSSIAALNKGDNYMGLYYEFIEAWWIAMYLELGTMNAFTERLFGCGYGSYTPSFPNWFSKGYAGTSGGMYQPSYASGGAVIMHPHRNVWGQFNSISFPMMLEAQKILDDVVRCNLTDAVDSGLLMTYESSGNSNSGSVIMASDYTATYTDESGETISGSVTSPTFDGNNFELME